MGATSSVQSNEVDADPWWSPRSSQHTQPNVLEHEGATQVNVEDAHNEVMAVGEEMWLKQIQDLGKVIQNLASENLKLLDSNKELRQKCEEQERIQEESNAGKESNENLQIVTHLQQEAENDKRLIEDLRQQLQTRTENSAVEVEKYHENLNFMQMKIKEYKQVVEKLEKDAAVQNNVTQCLQNTVCTDPKEAAEQSAGDSKVVIETLEQEYRDCQEENKTLKEQIEAEKNMRMKTEEENQKLQEELKHINEAVHFNTEKSLFEGSVVGTLEDSNGETDQSPTTSNTGGNEETRTLSARAAAELEVFQNQLKVKREARHKALSAISMEMERLRKELNSEREVRQNAVRELEKARSMSDVHQIYEEVNNLKHKLSSERQEKDKIFKEMIEVRKQDNEEIESILKQLEKEKEKTQCTLEENKFIKEQLQESDQMLQLRSQENSELQNKLETDKEKYQQQVLALKDVVAISKEMLTVRENQVTHLKQTLQDIEASVIQKNHGSLTAGLRTEYETQMENIKALKALYEERTQAMSAEKERLIDEQKDLQRLIEEEKRKIEELEVQLQQKEEIISERNATVSDLQDQLSDAIDQSRNLSHELTLINNMFTQILGNNDMDLDRLTKLLQENHDLITEITTKGDCGETTASLPKLLLDLVCHAENAEGKSEENSPQDTNENSPITTKAQVVNEEESADQVVNANSSGAHLAMQDISSNLPKVWKVLLELVSHHIPSPSEESSEDSKTSCYKSIDTPYGPKDVISVSKTFLRLRDLILQKKSLQKEVTRLKQLNVHLEVKLNDQERRLSLVSTELRKTWSVVDHMRVQHQQLHTHEKVLRYELQQKRKLLTELKEELEYCREKWEDARQKNSQSENEWQKLRKEFAMRKTKPVNNSGESGFSEEKDEDSSDNEVTKVQGLLSQTKSSSDNMNNSHHAVCIGQTVIKPEDTETVNASGTSLPDLVSVTTDLPLPPSEMEVSMATISSNNIVNEVAEESIPLLENIVQEALSLENDSNDSAVLEQSVLDDCPTVSLATLLKRQLSCFSRNLEIITAEFDTNDHFKALQSIFSLPAIQIPEHLNSAADEPSTLSLMINANSNSSKRTSIDRGIQCTEDCQEYVRKEDSLAEKNSEFNAGIVHEEEKIISDPVKTSTSSSSLSQSFDARRPENVSFPSLMENNEDSHGVTETYAHSSKDSLQGESKAERMQRLQRQCQQLFDKVVTGKTEDTNDTACSAEAKEQPKSQSDSRESGKETRDLENMLDARAARLKRLEEQSQQLFKKVKRTTHRSVELSNRLEELHEQYGGDDSTADEMIQQTMSNDPCSNELPNSSTVHDLLSSELSTHDNASSSATSHPFPSTSTHIPNSVSVKDVFDTQGARPKRLEEQSQQLTKKKVLRTTHHQADLSDHVEELNGQFGCENVTENAVPSASAPSVSTLSDIPKPPDLPHHLERSVPQTLHKPPENIHFRENDSCSPLSSISPTKIPVPPPPLENLLDARAARLKRLEEQSQQLFNKVKRTTNRSAELSNKLEELHEHYGYDSTSINSVGSSGSRVCERLPLQDCHCECSPSLPTISSNHIPTPPPLPSFLPPVRLPTEMDELNTSHDNARQQDTEDDTKEQR